MEQRGMAEWARIGAAARLQSIDQEKADILKAFPELGRRAGFTLGSTSSVATPRRRMSAAAKKAMSEGMRRYWARRKGLSAAASPSKKPAKAKPKRVFSAEARSRLSQLAKARWAKAKKAGKSRLG